MAELIKPKEVTLKDSDGGEKTFIISKIPAVDARKVLAMYPVANMPKVGDYSVSEEAMYLLMKYVAVQVTEERQQQLTSRALIDNHVSDGEQLMRLEMAMLQYNTSFFQNGGNSDFFAAIIRKYLPLITKTLMDSLPQLSRRATPPSPNSKRP